MHVARPLGGAHAHHLLLRALVPAAAGVPDQPLANRRPRGLGVDQDPVEVEDDGVDRGQADRSTPIRSSRPSISVAGASAAVVGHRGGERLAGHVCLVGASGVEELRVARQAELDPVGDLEARLAAGVLHGVDDLARQPLATKLVVELQRPAPPRAPPEAST